MRLQTSVAVLALVASMTGIPVKADTAEAPSDDQIAIAVSEALERDEVVPHENLTVVVTDGVVSVGGNVDTLLAEQRTLELVGAVRGVNSYYDSISVVPDMSYSDELIRANIVRGLATNGATDSYEIEPTVVSGVVTLGGTVDSWVERELAARVAMDTDGVIAVENDIAILYDDTRIDEEIEADVTAALRWAADVDHRFIDTEVTDGTVRLIGTVDSVPEQLSAYTEAWVAGVRDVDVEDLIVLPFGADNMDSVHEHASLEDEEIESAVERRLLYSPRVGALGVDVEVDEGVAVLTGNVDHLAASWAAVDVAARTTGVIGVVNNLSIEVADTLTDSEIESNVEAALNRSVFFDDGQIDAIVSNNVVELNGDVQTVTAKVRAEDIATSITGVAEVYNNIVVVQEIGDLIVAPFTQGWDFTFYPWYAATYYDAERSDAEIATDIRGELWWSPFVDSDDVVIDVNEGVATLTGSVSTLSEWRAAEENALEGGARVVVNQIEIEYGS